MTLVLFLGGAGVSVVIMRKPGKTRTSSQLLTGRRRPALVIVALGLTMAALAMPGCASTYPNRAVVGERLPSVTGESLAGKPVRLPEDLEGQPAVLLLGYTQRAQFDADRWILGLIQAGVKTRLLEVPTIEGLMPRAFSDRIDEGMRRGIPSEDWASVVTVYDGAQSLLLFTGNERPNNMRVLLLDPAGQVVWHHDRGYSATKVLELKAAANTLEAKSDSRPKSGPAD